MSIYILFYLFFIIISDIPIPTHRKSISDLKTKNYNEKYGDHMKEIFSYESPTNNSKTVSYNSPPRNKPNNSGNKTAVELIKEQMAKAKARAVNVYIIILLLLFIVVQKNTTNIDYGALEAEYNRYRMELEGVKTRIERITEGKNANTKVKQQQKADYYREKEQIVAKMENLKKIIDTKPKNY